MTILISALISCDGQGIQYGSSPTIVAADSGSAPAFTDGMQEIRGDDGNLRMKGALRNGKRHGPWASYFPDGTVRSQATYVDGMQEGATEVYHGAGVIYYTGQYFKDRPVGEWTFFDTEGNLVKHVQYDSSGVLLKQ